MTQPTPPDDSNPDQPKTPETCPRCDGDLKFHCNSTACTWGRCPTCKVRVTSRGRVVHDSGKVLEPGSRPGA